MERAEWIAEAREFVRREVRAAYVPTSSVAERAAEYLEDEADPDEVVAFAEPLVEEAVAEVEAERRDWPEPTDNQRLDRAFAALERDGVVARQNFWCCQTCGHAAMPDEMRAAAERGPVHGYTFFHEQDTESAVDGGGLFLAYGAADDGDPGVVGERIRAALQGAGLEVEWDGDVRRRISVRLRWQRPPLRG